jgi:hypothetical protein
MGSKAITGGHMPSPNSHFSPQSVGELADKLMRALGLTTEEMDRRSIGVSNIQRIGEDVVVTAYSGGKFSTHVDKIDHFPSDTLIDRLRLLF